MKTTNNPSLSESSEVRVKSPTRVDLAGGTLDLWPLYAFLGKATTVNLAVDIFTDVYLKESNQVRFISEDIKLDLHFESLSDALGSTDDRLNLYRPVLAYFIDALENCKIKGFTLKTGSQSPVGGGLGGSSSLTIGLLKAFGQLCGVQFKDVHHMVHVAHNLEAQLLNTPTGTQDYYPAASGGINILTYTADGIQQRVLSPKDFPISDWVSLIYTGRAHHSGLNNFEVLTRSVQKDPVVLKALEDLNNVSAEMVQQIEKRNWDVIPSLFRREFDSRLKLADSFCSPEILQLEKISKDHGADAIKICGAGGGGCVMLWTTPSKKSSVESAVQAAGFKVLNIKPVDPIL